MYFFEYRREYITSNLVPNGDLSKGNSSWECYPTNCSVVVVDQTIEYPFLNVFSLPYEWVIIIWKRSNIKEWLRIDTPPCCYSSFTTLAYSVPGFDFGSNGTLSPSSLSSFSSLTHPFLGSLFYELSFVAYSAQGGMFSTQMRENHDPYTNLAATNYFSVSPNAAFYGVR